MSVTKSRAPGRPRSFELDDALDTAIRLFQAKGYDAVGVAELVTALGIKPPSFYAAFGSKAGLLEQAIERYSASDANVFTQARDAGGSVAEVIDRTLRLAARAYPACGGTAGCLVLDGVRNSADPAARAIETRTKTASTATIREYIADEYPDQAEALARLVVIALSGMSAAARDGATAEDLEAFASVFGVAIRQQMETGPAA